MAQDTQVRLVATIEATSKGLMDALKQASGAVNSATTNWKDRFSSLKDATGTIQQSVKNLADLVKEVGDVNMDVQGMEKVNSAISAVSDNFGKVKADVDDFVAKLVEMRQQASSLSMPIDEYQRFAEAVRASGVSLEESSQMMLAMQRNINDFVNGVPEAKQVFDKLGITIDQISSNTVSANFQEIVRAINETIPASERATQNMQMFKAAIDKTLAVADQYNKAVSRQSGSYASDKDLQNAISMQGILAKLGEQMSNFAEKTSQAGEAGGKAGEQISIWLQRQREEFAIVTAEIDRYINSIDDMSKSLNGATSAIGVLVNRTNEFKNIGKNATDATKAQAKDLYESFSSLSGKILTEYDKISQIINNRLKVDSGFVDTKELDEARKHIDGLFEACQNLFQVQKDMNLSVSFESMQSFVDFQNVLGQVKNDLEGLSNMSANRNIPLEIDEMTKAVNTLEAKFHQTKHAMEKGVRVKFDTKEIEDADRALSRLRAKASTVFGKGESTDNVDNLKQRVADLTSEVQRYNAEVAKGTPIWQPITNAVNRVRTAVNNVTGSIKKNHISWRSVGEAIKNCWTYMTHYKSQSDAAGASGKTLGMTLKQAAGQLLGMGTAVAVITKAWQNINALVREYIKNLEEAEVARTYGNAEEGAKDMTRVREKNDAKLEELAKKLAEFADLYDEEKKTGSVLAKAKRTNLQEELSKMYNFEFEEVNGEIQNMDAQIARKLDELTKSRIEAIEAQIKANRRVIDGASEYIKGMTYWKMVRGNLSGDFGWTGRYVEKAQEASTNAVEETMKITEEKNRLQKEELSAQYMRLRAGKQYDVTQKAEREALEATRKEEEARAKALEEANKALDDWKNSINDNDRQKKIRAIMEKYEQLVSAGVEETKARNAAEHALAGMLEEEFFDRIKKNKELLDALDKSIEAYKSAYAEYLNAQKDVTNAQKDYARAQQDLARQARAERLQRRRDAIARKLQTYGFQLPTGFHLNESRSSARRRVRRQELDSSIQEKLQDWQSGKKVHWTRQERDRLKDYQKLQRKDRQLEAAQKQMQAADKQRQAAETLQKAADAIRVAMLDRSDAVKNLNNARGELNQAGRRKGWIPEYVNPSTLFENAKNKGLSAPGVKGREYNRQMNYNGAFSQLHKDLMDIMRKTYLVR